MFLKDFIKVDQVFRNNPFFYLYTQWIKKIVKLLLWSNIMVTIIIIIIIIITSMNWKHHAFSMKKLQRTYQIQKQKHHNLKYFQNPGRPVVRSINCHYTKTSKYINLHLQPHVKEIKLYAKDSINFI